MISSHLQAFNELSIDELYSILKLRSAIFIVEQQCCYLDMDDKDAQALHLSLRNQQEIIAYARLLPHYDGEAVSFGRLLTIESYRGRGLATEMVEFILAYFAQHHAQQKIVITAQLYLKAFYERYQFIAEGNPFELEGRPHIYMVRDYDR